MELVERAHAKINLHLHVVGRREDGYHLLDSLVVFAGAHDVLSAQPGAGLSLELEGRFAGGLAGEAASDNLVIRAARLLQEQAGTPEGASLRLRKQLPVASGIGGGSADAAAALRLLRRFWNTRSDASRLLDLAAALGADVPVCVEQRPALMGGIGEVLQPAPDLPECFMVLVNCGLAVSTPAVFRARPPGYRAPAEMPPRWLDAAAMAADLGRLSNDLEATAVVLCPPIADVLSAIAAQPGCLLSRMSGSGATCFGLFAHEQAARDAARVLDRVAGWWVWGGAMLRSDPLAT
ncbi:4-(cytidine 5'-diphospho)-2-C-methyl-D-erythritol kinase [Lichenicola sp.]|uniref:4-(cytidine 5'-diphospho)-2-C-methyl-D-erythritol kinase n=1 Tax=Lichenicola sp. TaxID=2804529 RepID=UPI003AFFC3D9